MNGFIMNTINLIVSSVVSTGQIMLFFVSAAATCIFELWFVVRLSFNFFSIVCYVRFLWFYIFLKVKNVGIL